MKPFRDLTLVVSLAFLTAACDDSTKPPRTGALVLQIELGEEAAGREPAPAADSTPHAGPSAPSGTLSHLDSARATVTGPTTKTQTLTKAGSGFTGTITDLTPGSYIVSITGWAGGEVDYFGRTTATVSSGQSTPATITFGTFQPDFATITSPTTAFRINTPFSIIATADSYQVQLSNSSSFSPIAAEAWLQNSPAVVSVGSTGNWYLRARAANTQVPAGGRWGSTAPFQVVTDLRTSGDDPGSSPPSLGFFATSAVTLDSLNIYPVGDGDWFSVSQCNGDSLTITAQAVRLTPPSPLNSVLHVYNSTGRLVAEGDDVDSTDARVAIQHTADGTYRVRVSGTGSNNRNTGHYRLQVGSKAGGNNLTSSCRVTTLATTALSSGRNHACAIRTVTATNVIDCWGLNFDGQLGDGTNTTTSSPVRVASTLSFGNVYAGGFHTCALSGTAAYCWGSNLNGQLGDNSTTDRNTPARAGGTLAFFALATGTAHTCGINGTGPSGTVYCWGDNSQGQLGNGTTNNSSMAVSISSGLTFQSLTAGDRYTCGITSGGVTYCWGENTDGQLGDGTTTDRLTPTLVSTAVANQLVAVSAGLGHTCGLTAGGAAYCWGDNSSGELGDNTTISRSQPTLVQGGIAFSAITAGARHTCGANGSGNLYCWGQAVDGQLGNGSTLNSSTPTPVSGGPLAGKVSAGGWHTCAIENGSNNTYCWGWNHFGQVGDGSGFDHTGPVAVSGGQVWKQVSMGNLHTCGVATNNTAFCWGWNGSGQLGISNFTSQTTPTQVTTPGGVTFTAVGAGAAHSCALTSVGQVYCWGDNTDGQVGDGSTLQRLAPVLVSGLAGITQLSVGDFHNCARNSSGTVSCWGYNGDGQLGNNSTVNSLTPITVVVSPTNVPFTSVSAGGTHTCGVATSGLVYCWGDNSYGGLGTGSTVNALTPTLIQGGLSFASVSAAYWYTCGRTTGNAAYCWGRNQFGQLGTGDNSTSNVPVAVAGNITWQQVSASRNVNACGAAQSGTAYCWGANGQGQLGTGSFNRESSPTPVFTAVQFTAVQSGDGSTCGVSSSPSGGLYCWGNNEAGQLGNGSRTIRTTPQAVLVGPSSAPGIEGGSSRLVGRDPSPTPAAWGARHPPRRPGKLLNGERN